MFTEVVKTMVGPQGLDAYILIEGGAVRLYEPQVAPALQMLQAQPHELSMQMTIYIVDGRTFEIAAVSRANLVQKAVPGTWFVAPRQNAGAIKAAIVDLLDRNLEPALRKAGLL